MQNLKSAESGNSARRGPLGPLIGLWKRFATAYPSIAQFLVFFMLSNGITVLQMAVMPTLKALFELTPLIQTDFRIWPVGTNLDGSPFYIFNYPANSISNGGGGGLAYFLAVQITIALAQVINFFAQRTITFKSNTNPWKAALWYVIAYICISIGAAAAQGLYKVPIYGLLMNTWAMGAAGETLADFITMIINSTISFWVFFPIFKLIFTRTPEQSPDAQKENE